ncbi:unnamed protein product [Tenebrio molitor]|nr:unnamed protein product [Tenebrio molitor]
MFIFVWSNIRVFLGGLPFNERLPIQFANNNFLQ